MGLMIYEYEIEVNATAPAALEAAIDEIDNAVLAGPTINTAVGQVQAEDGDADAASSTVLISFKIIGAGNGEPGQTLRRINSLECVTSIESC
jgi:orotate phosphoribosyltransferase-like protein